MKKSLALALSLMSLSALGGQRPCTLDDEMKLRSIVDVKISPDGKRVAYEVSTPNLTKNEHEVVLYLGNTRLAEKLRILNKPFPRPGLRWSPDGTMVSLLATAGEKPQVFAIPISGAAPRQLTDASEGVSGSNGRPTERASPISRAIPQKNNR